MALIQERKFKLSSEFSPTGDQPKAIESLVAGFNSGIKYQTMMGVTGSLEAFFCVQAIQTQTSPPTIHYETPDPDCDLDYVPNNARDACINVAISNSFGFGGHNSVLLFKKYV